MGTFALESEYCFNCEESLVTFHIMRFLIVHMLLIFMFSMKRSFILSTAGRTAALVHAAATSSCSAVGVRNHLCAGHNDCILSSLTSAGGHGCPAFGGAGGAGGGAADGGGARGGNGGAAARGRGEGATTASGSRLVSARVERP